MKIKNFELRINPWLIRLFGSYVIAFGLGMLTCLVILRACSNPYEVIKEDASQEIEIVELEHEEEVKVNTEAEAIARVLYGVSAYNLSDNAKTAIIEVIINRAECTYGEFGDTIEDVCNKPNQWQGYVKDGCYLACDYDLANEYLGSNNSARVAPEGCFYLVCGDGYVTVRTEWNGGNSWKVQ